MQIFVLSLSLPSLVCRARPLCVPCKAGTTTQPWAHWNVNAIISLSFLHGFLWRTRLKSFLSILLKAISKFSVIPEMIAIKVSASVPEADAHRTAFEQIFLAGFRNLVACGRGQALTSIVPPDIQSSSAELLAFQQAWNQTQTLPQICVEGNLYYMQDFICPWI